MTQQRLACLGDAHLDCPLFVRSGYRARGSSAGRTARVTPVPVAAPSAISERAAGGATERPHPAAVGLATALDVVDGLPPPESGPAGRSDARPAPPIEVTRAARGRQARPASRPMPTIVAALILIAALVVAFAFTTRRGGMSMPGGGSGSSGIAAGASATGVPTGPGASTSATSTEPGSPSPAPSAAPAATPAISPGASATHSPGPSPTLGPRLTPTPGPAPTPAGSLPPAFAGLDPCPDGPACYLYTIHSGDNLTRVALRFGVTLTALQAANPAIVDPSLIHVGDVIRIPVPASTP